MQRDLEYARSIGDRALEASIRQRMEGGDLSLPTEQSRSRSGSLPTEKARLVGRFRDLGYSDEEISRTVNPPDATRGTWPGPLGDLQEYYAGVGQELTTRGQGVEQFVRHAVPGVPQGDIDERIAERQRLDESGGLNDNSAAGFGRLVTSAAPYIAAAPAMAQAGLLPSIAGQAAFETVTQPVGTDQDYWSGLGQRAGKELALAAVPDVGAAVLQQGVKQGGRIVDKGMDALELPAKGDPWLRADPRELAEGNRLVQSTGVPLTAYERGQARGVGQLEQMARESMFSGGIVKAADEFKNRKLEEGLNNYLATLGPNAPRAEVARRVQQYVETHAEELFEVRRQVAENDYGQVRAWEGGQPSVEAGAYATWLQDRIRRGNAAGASADDVTLAKDARARMQRLQAQTHRAVADELAAQNPGIDPEQLDQAVADALEQMRPQEMLLTGEDIADIARSSDKEFGGTVFQVNDVAYHDAMVNQMRAAVTNAAHAADPELARLLLSAQRNYAINSEAIDTLEASGLGKIVGEELASDVLKLRTNRVAPERVYTKLWALPPSDLEASMQYLARTAPDLLGGLQRQFIEEAMKASKMVSAAGGPTSKVINPAAFLRTLGVRGSEADQLMNMQRLDALFGSNPNYGQLRDFIDVARRMGDRQLANLSRTDIRNEARSYLAQAAAVVGTTLIAGAKLVPTMGAWPLLMRGVAKRMDPRHPNFLRGGAPVSEQPWEKYVPVLPGIPAAVGENIGEER